nr:hypothetical protein [Tanacetum cinerariifolium]
MIKEIDQNAEIALDDETQGRKNDDEMFGVDDLAGEEVVMDSATEPVTTVKGSAAPTTHVTEDEITIVQALAALKSVKHKVVLQEQEMSTTIPAAATKVTTVVPTSRAKESYKLKNKRQQGLAGLNKIKKLTILGITYKLLLYANRLLAKRLQAREREDFSEVQKARLLVELIDKRKKHFAALRAQEKRSKPPTKTQMKS